MRFKIECRSIHPPYNFLVRLEDGRLIKDTMACTRVPLRQGSTGNIINDERGRPRIVLDAIEAEVVTDE